MQVNGTIKSINESKQITDSFIKRTVVIESDEKYPQMLEVEFFNRNAELLDTHNVGDLITVDINLRGREYNGKFYMNIQGWRITGDAHVDASSKWTDRGCDKKDDLPF